MYKEILSRSDDSAVFDIFSIQRLEAEQTNIEAEENRALQKIKQINIKKCKLLEELKDLTQVKPAPHPPDYLTVLRISWKIGQWDRTSGGTYAILKNRMEPDMSDSIGGIA